MKSFFKSSIGKKMVMAVSGICLFGFIVGHLIGNLGVFLGQDSFNAYAHFLKTTPAILWPTRIGLIILVVLHIVSAFQLRAINQKARKDSYVANSTVQASAASLYMLEGGIILLIFIIVHLLHFTVGVLLPENFSYTDSLGRHDVYKMLILGFQNGFYSVGYIIAMLCLGLHLSHGIQSFFQTLGFFHERYTECIKKLSCFLGWGIALCYIIIPLSVMIGFLTLPGGG